MVSRSGLLFAYKGNHFFANKQISCCFFFLFREELGGGQSIPLPKIRQLNKHFFYLCSLLVYPCRAAALQGLVRLLIFNPGKSGPHLHQKQARTHTTSRYVPPAYPDSAKEFNDSFAWRAAIATFALNEASTLRCRPICLQKNCFFSLLQGFVWIFGRIMLRGSNELRITIYNLQLTLSEPIPIWRKDNFFRNADIA